jgi:hypothetical protein
VRKARSLRRQSGMTTCGGAQAAFWEPFEDRLRFHAFDVTP